MQPSKWQPNQAQVSELMYALEALALEKPSHPLVVNYVMPVHGNLLRAPLHACMHACMHARHHRSLLHAGLHESTIGLAVPSSCCLRQTGGPTVNDILLS